MGLPLLGEKGGGLAIRGGELRCGPCNARVQLHRCKCGAWSLVCRWCGEAWAVRRCPSCGGFLMLCLAVEGSTGQGMPRELSLACAAESCTWRSAMGLVDVVVMECDHREAVH